MTHRPFALVAASLAFAPVAAVQLPAAKAPSTHCECLNWKATYEQGLVSCGEGHEFYDVIPSKSPALYRIDTPGAQEKECSKFFSRLNFSYCVSMSPGTEYGTWCYVDRQCEALTGGHRLANVSWKQCGAQSDNPELYRLTAVKRDAQLRDLTLPELHAISEEQDLWFGGLVKMAYPGARAGENEPVKLEDFRTQVPAWADQRVAKGGFHSTPYWFDTNEEGALPIVVVAGGKTFEVHKNPHQDAAHPGTWASFRCLFNC